MTTPIDKSRTKKLQSFKTMKTGSFGAQKVTPKVTSQMSKANPVVPFWDPLKTPAQRLIEANYNLKNIQKGLAGHHPKSAGTHGQTHKMIASRTKSMVLGRKTVTLTRGASMDKQSKKTQSRISKRTSQENNDFFQMNQESNEMIEGNEPKRATPIELDQPFLDVLNSSEGFGLTPGH